MTEETREPTRASTRRRWALVAFFSLSSLVAGTAACSAILGIDPPPESSSSADASVGADAPPVDAPAPYCAPQVDDSGTTYTPFSLSAVDDAGNSVWQAYSPAGFAMAGGAYDGTFVYFASHNSNKVVRYDPSQPFDSATAWTPYTLTGVPASFLGAVFDGTYVYFIPGGSSSVVVRYDPSRSFTTESSWEELDLATLPEADAGAPLVGFAGGVFDGRYLYLVPSDDPAPFGRVVRYDTAPPALVDAGVPRPDASVDAGVDAPVDAREDAPVDAAPHDASTDAVPDASGDASGDADPPADAAAPPDAPADAASDASIATAGDGFLLPGQWEVFDLGAFNVRAAGFYGGATGGKSVFFSPYANDVFDSGLHGGASGTIARFRGGDAGFTTSSSWTTFDMTDINGLLYQMAGAGFDGQYVYFAPFTQGIVPRYDTTFDAKDGGLASAAAWSTYDVTRVVPTTAAGTRAQFRGVAFDGRYMYFVPARGGQSILVRYDTESTFSADCAWSALDLSPVVGADAAGANFAGAVFDGRYLYLVPDSLGTVVRFDTKTPAALPALPAHGSFL